MALPYNSSDDVSPAQNACGVWFGSGWTITGGCGSTVSVPRYTTAGSIPTVPVT